MMHSMQQPLYSDEAILKAWQQAEPHVRNEVLKILRIWEALEKRERDAVVRAETAEQQVRNLTAELDRAHRELDFLRKADRVSKGCT